MCGIGGVISLKGPLGEERLKFAKQVCDNLLIGLSSRGTDATGIAHIRSDADNYSYRIYKQPVKASAFIEHQEYKDSFGPDSNVIFLHTRAKTAGDAKNNANNHPHYNKVTGNIQVHNGVISMHEFLKNQHELKMDGECDSEVLLKMLEKFGFRKGLSKVSGSAAIAFSNAAARQIILYASSNPLCLAYVPQADLFVFASTLHILNNAMGKRETERFNGLEMQKFTRYVDYFSMELDDETKVQFNMRKQKVSVENKVKMDHTVSTIGGYGRGRGSTYGDNVHLYDGYNYDLDRDNYDAPVKYTLPKSKESTSIEEIHASTTYKTAETIRTAALVGFTKEEILAYFKARFPTGTYADLLVDEHFTEVEESRKEDEAYLRRAWTDSQNDPNTFADEVIQMGYTRLDVKAFLQGEKVGAGKIEAIMTALDSEELFNEEMQYMDGREEYQ